MPGKKRGRDDGSTEGGEESQPKRSSSHQGILSQCKNGHELVLVPREVRRLEKDEVWSCDSGDCSQSWEHESGPFLDRLRYRCVHYRSGGGCNFDICGNCYRPKLNDQDSSSEVRKSGREPKPKYPGRKDEWVLAPNISPHTSPRQVKSSPRRHHSGEGSPKRQSRVLRDLNRSGSRSKSPGPATRRRSGKEGADSANRTVRESAGTAKKMIQQGYETESDEEDEEEDEEEEEEEEEEKPKRGRRSKREESPPFYPAPHVRFSPSAKNASPYGRKTRSSRRGMVSYIQSLPSEDEQSEFNRQYSRDLRKRQARRVSEDGGGGLDDERSSSRHNNEETSSGGGGAVRELRRVSRRTRSESQSELDTPADKPKRSIRARRLASESEEDQSLAARKRSLRSRQTTKKDQEDEEGSDEEDAADPTVTEASVRRGLRKRRQVEPDDADTESAQENNKQEETEESEESEEEESGVRRSSRRTRVQVNRFHYDVPTRQTRGGRNEKLRNLDQYSSGDDFQGETSPKKKKYSLRQKRVNTNRYQDEFPARDDAKGKDKALIRRSAMAKFRNSGQRGSASASNSRDRNGSSRRRSSNRQRTGDSSSPSSSSCSDEEAFERRKSKRMTIERDKLLPLNMNKNDMAKAIFKERAQVGASMADVQPMEMDMGVTFESVGGLTEHVNALKEMVMFPLLYPELFNRFNIVPPRGVLFYGPPGTGKTLLARALASECSTESRKVAFFMRKGADCLSKWIGESERQLRLLFDQAYQMRPSIIFFDEIDGLAPVRSSRQDQIHSSIVSTLLALMDGLDNRGEIIVIGATNRIENIDPALRRPGRFDRELAFSLPCKATRKEILKLHTRSWEPALSGPLLNFLAARTLGYCGADLKGLCAEAALNALRRSYPQVYQSSRKLLIDVGKVSVVREDFDRAMRKIVPSTHRVEDKVLSPLPKYVRPLLEPTYHSLCAAIRRIFPHSAAGKGAVLPMVLTHRPRLLLVGSEGQGQTTYLGPALLHFMEKFPCQKLDIPALFSNSARTPEEACTQIVHSARRTMPGILYIPHLCLLWDTVGETVRATLTTLLADLPPTSPLLILGVSDRPYASLPPELQTMFLAYYREVFKLENPGENERREYFRPLIASCSALPPKPPEPPAPVETLPLAPEPECRKLTAREEKRLRRKEEALLRELRIFLRDIWAKINRESKFFMFRVPVNTEEVDDYLEYVKKPMDLEMMHMKLDDGEYKCAQDFLDDIDLMAENAIAYNCDLAYETNRIICHRARALQDFAYALVKAEMDTDFEEECKEIVARREKATEKLKKIDKENPELAPVSPSKMQDMLAIVATACEICGSRADDSNMLLCDGCDDGYHTYCTAPPMDEVPEGDWYCVKCEAAGLDTSHQGEGGEETAEEGGGSAQRKKRRRKSKWASGVANHKKKLSSRKKILESEDEKTEESQLSADPMDMTETSDTATPVAGPSRIRQEPQFEESCTRLSRSTEIERIRDSSALAPVSHQGEEVPSQPTGVRIDSSKLAHIHTELVRLTENWPVEKIERVNNILAKVIRGYKTQFDRTNLPADLQAEIDSIKSQERQPEHTMRIRR